MRHTWQLQRLRKVVVDELLEHTKAVIVFEQEELRLGLLGGCRPLDHISPSSAT